MNCLNIGFLSVIFFFMTLKTEAQEQSWCEPSCIDYMKYRDCDSLIVDGGKCLQTILRNNFAKNIFLSIDDSTFNFKDILVKKDDIKYIDFIVTNFYVSEEYDNINFSSLRFVGFGNTNLYRLPKSFFFSNTIREFYATSNTNYVKDYNKVLNKFLVNNNKLQWFSLNANKESYNNDISSVKLSRKIAKNDSLVSLSICIDLGQKCNFELIKKKYKNLKYMEVETFSDIRMLKRLKAFSHLEKLTITYTTKEIKTLINQNFKNVKVNYIKGSTPQMLKESELEAIKKALER